MAGGESSCMLDFCCLWRGLPMVAWGACRAPLSSATNVTTPSAQSCAGPAKAQQVVVWCSSRHEERKVGVSISTLPRTPPP